MCAGFYLKFKILLEVQNFSTCVYTAFYKVASVYIIFPGLGLYTNEEKARKLF